MEPRWPVGPAHDLSQYTTDSIMFLNRRGFAYGIPWPLAEFSGVWAYTPNHGVQLGMAAMSVIETAYCTQQTGGLTRGVTLRAIHAAKANCGATKRSAPCQSDATTLRAS
jgi:hypothetical protein